MNTFLQFSRPCLATRFAGNTRVLRGDGPLSEDQMQRTAPSIFAEGKHASRSERYTYIPTIDLTPTPVRITAVMLQACTCEEFFVGG
jgi:hypothetical protein